MATTDELETRLAALEGRVTVLEGHSTTTPTTSDEPPAVTAFKKKWHIGLDFRTKDMLFKRVYGRPLGTSLPPLLARPLVPAQVEEYATWGYDYNGLFINGLVCQYPEDRDAVTAQAMDDIAWGRQTFATGYGDPLHAKPVDGTVNAVITMTGIAWSYQHYLNGLGVTFGDPARWAGVAFDEFVRGLAGGPPSGG